MAIDVDAVEEARRDVVDRPRAHGIHYIGGGSTWRGHSSPYACPGDAPISRLVGDLIASRDARLRTALVALLLRHPEYVASALDAAQTLNSRERLLADVSVLVAAALQAMWAFSPSPRQVYR